VTGGFSTAGGSSSALSDRTPPAISGWAVCDQDGLAAPATANWLHSAGTYVVFANVSDALSGVASVTASVGLVGSAPFASPTLSAGGGTCGGTVYGYRSAVLTAPTLTAGPKPVYADVVATDGVGNTGHSNAARAGDVGVDNTTPGTPAVSSTTGPAGSGKITWTWTPPTAGASGLAGYQVQVCNFSTGTCLPTVVLAPNATSYPVTGTSGQWYYVLVTASSNSGLNGSAGFAFAAAP
jgi:hypothetical protein